MKLLRINNDDGFLCVYIELRFIASACCLRFCDVCSSVHMSCTLIARGSMFHDFDSSIIVALMSEGEGT